VRGTIPVLKERVVVFSTPGQDGYGRHNVGKSSGEFTLQVTKYGTKANVRTWEHNILGLVGNTARITIANDLGDSNANCSVVDAGQPFTQPAVNSAAGYEVKSTIVLSCIVEA